MSLELIILLVFFALLAFSLVKRVLWLALVAVAIGAMIHFGVFELLFDFVRQTLITSPIIITIG